MRVLVITNMWPTPGEPSAGCFVKEQVDDLRRCDIEVEVLSFDGRKNELNYGRAALLLHRLLRREHFDLVHAHFGLTGAIALTQRSVPVITTFHGSDTGYIRWQLPISYAVARLSHPIFVSRDGAERLRRPLADIIPAGVDLNAFEPLDRAEARQQLGWSVRHRYVLFPGSPQKMVKRKDLFDQVIRVIAADMPEIRPVVLAGYDRREVRLVMNAVDAMLMTSDSEGSPVTVKEALASLTPVVSVDVGDVRTVLAGLPGCSVVARNPLSLAAALRNALETDRTATWRARATEYARPHIAKQVLRVYRRVLR